jgi:hypothetical protein
MAIDGIENEALRKSIARHVEKDPACQKVFDEFFSIFEVIDIICNVRIIERKYIDNFVWGMLIAVPLALRDSKYENRASALMTPVFNEVASYMQNEYQDYLISRNLPLSFLTDNEFIGQFTFKGLKQFIKSKNLIPLTDEDIHNIAVIYEQEQRFFT